MNNTNGGSSHLGIVIAGSLLKGVDVKLDSGISVEDITVGHYVAVRGNKKRFLGMITDISLDAVDPGILSNPPQVSDPFIAEVISGITTYGKLHVLPLLALGNHVSGLIESPQPARTIPVHYSPVETASQSDIEIVFGKEDSNRFYIGNPMDMETKVCLNLVEMVKRSNGVFGKSGTGKTFLTRLLLIGIVQKNAAVNLIFDMHNEYGWEGSSEFNAKVKGLKQLFPSKVVVFALDEESSIRRKVTTDFIVRIGYDEIEPEDIELLRQTLNLTEAAVQAVYQLARVFGHKNWLENTNNLDDDSSKDLLEKLHIHESTYRNLKRGLDMLKRFGFLASHVENRSVKSILEYLERGTNVVLDFGRYDDIVAYMLVANLLSRRIYVRYRDKTELAMGTDSPKPIPLVITIEEAHRFLNPELASRTIFGKIAREMRKYNVTLLVIDQRPSGIDEEIMSQLGTKITCLLDNEKDVDNVLAGVSGRGELKSVLSKLESKQQALIFGHSVPMPVVIKTRSYGSAESYKEFGFLEAGELKRRTEEEIKGL